MTVGEANLIKQENLKPGTRDWMISKVSTDNIAVFRSPAIEGYCSAPSVTPGDQLQISVSMANPGDFSLSIYRMGYYQGQGGRLMGEWDRLAAFPQPEPAVGAQRVRACRWASSVELIIEDDWVSGVYVGKLTALASGSQSYVIFVVRDNRPADLMVQCSDITWQAYNRWPSLYSLYDDGAKVWYLGPGVSVSFDRPYGKYCQVVDQPLSTGSGAWFLFEYPFSYWLEAEGYDVTYVSGIDTHLRGEGIARAKGFLSVGHDEYYSQNMYDAVVSARDHGVGLGFFSGDAVDGRIEFDGVGWPGKTRSFSRVDRFGPVPEGAELGAAPELDEFPHVSENSRDLVGGRTEYPNSGVADWVCRKDDHWIYAGTGMKDGDRIRGVIGFESQGDPARRDDLVVVADGKTSSGAYWASTVYRGNGGNIVFNAATCWWADGLAEPPGYVRPLRYTPSPVGPDRRVQQITRNVLNAMVMG